MNSSQLNEGQRKLVAGLHNTGPTRWALRSPITKHAGTLREAMAAYMLETLNFRLNYEGIEKVKGLVVCPSANTRSWREAGWPGPAMPSTHFMYSVAVLADTFDCVLFDAQAEYPDRYIEQLDLFLEDPNATNAIFWLPSFEEGQEPTSLAKLLEVLKRHRFVSLKID